MKVQHHGSEHNTDKDFAAHVSADHYVFCGNGEHRNPDIGVVKTYIDARLGSNSAPQARAPKAAGRPFKMWFSSSVELGPRNAKAEAHMRELKKEVTAAVKKSKGRMKAVFNEKDVLTLTL